MCNRFHSSYFRFFYFKIVNDEIKTSNVNHTGYMENNVRVNERVERLEGIRQASPCGHNKTGTLERSFWCALGNCCAERNDTHQTSAVYQGNG